MRALSAPVIYNEVGEGHLASLLAQEEPIIFTESIFALLKIRDNKMNRQHWRLPWLIQWNNLDGCLMFTLEM